MLVFQLILCSENLKFLVYIRPELVIQVYLLQTTPAPFIPLAQLKLASCSNELPSWNSWNPEAKQSVVKRLLVSYSLSPPMTGMATPILTRLT